MQRAVDSTSGGCSFAGVTSAPLPFQTRDGLSQPDALEEAGRLIRCAAGIIARLELAAEGEETHDLCAARFALQGASALMDALRADR